MKNTKNIRTLRKWTMKDYEKSDVEGDDDEDKKD